ncbi:hypothetical protein C2E23DRAFT_215677 [Lenzites betulinus]|nr:hypothetical protein C2E23DRAFT_215677 [Lenzites betulinus]
MHADRPQPRSLDSTQIEVRTASDSHRGPLPYAVIDPPAWGRAHRRRRRRYRNHSSQVLVVQGRRPSVACAPAPPHSRKTDSENREPIELARVSREPSSESPHPGEDPACGRARAASGVGCGARGGSIESEEAVIRQRRCVRSAGAAGVVVLGLGSGSGSGYGFGRAAEGGEEGGERVVLVGFGGLKVWCRACRYIKLVGTG